MAKWEIPAKRRLVVAAIYGIVTAVWLTVGFVGNSDIAFLQALVWSALTAIWLGTGLKQLRDEKETARFGQVAAAPAPQPPQVSIVQGERAAAELCRLKTALQNPTVRTRVEQLEETSRKILAQIVLHPEKQSLSRQFLDYYLPTSVKVLDAYRRMENASGPEIQALRGRIEAMLENLCTAFDRQLDALLRDEVLDISADITVMEQMLQQEGFGGMTLGG